MRLFITHRQQAKTKIAADKTAAKAKTIKSQKI